VSRPGARPCSLADALSVIGEKWSLHALRELAYGVHRFDGIARNTGAPRDVLTKRLRHLEDAGVIERRRYQEHPPRFEYHLTAAGDELRPVLVSIQQWGDRWACKAPPVALEHGCGAPLELVHTCRACGDEVTGRDLHTRFLVHGWTHAGPVDEEG
jgi:DNA-binding HxlR family transcriptional regulator